MGRVQALAKETDNHKKFLSDTESPANVPSESVVYGPGNGVESPRLLRSVRPNYTAEAMRAKVQGVVRLEGVVLPDGSVGDVKVMRSLDPVFGLDQEAMKAARQFRFVPGTRFGEPVAVLVSFEIEFTLR